MRTAIICHSRHHGNTRRVAEAMAGVLEAGVYTVAEGANQDLSPFDLVGLGSGIYFGSHDSGLCDFVRNSGTLKADCFLFSTAGLASLSPVWHRRLAGIVRQRGLRVLGNFCCPGWDSVGPLRFFGGLHRKRPNENDLQRAAQFARELRLPSAPAGTSSANPIEPRDVD